MSPTFCKEGAYPIEVRKAIISASSAIASVRANHEKESAKFIGNLTSDHGLNSIFHSALGTVCR